VGSFREIDTIKLHTLCDPGAEGMRSLRDRPPGLYLTNELKYSRITNYAGKLVPIKKGGAVPGHSNSPMGGIQHTPRGTQGVATVEEG